MSNVIYHPSLPDALECQRFLLAKLVTEFERSLHRLHASIEIAPLDDELVAIMTASLARHVAALRALRLSLAGLGARSEFVEMPVGPGT
jgi:hypothetical protein